MPTALQKADVRFTPEALERELIRRSQSIGELAADHIRDTHGKYFDYQRHCRIAVKRCVDLDLFSGPLLSILDIGSGFGYFPAACSLLGHSAIGLNAHKELLLRATTLLDVAMIWHKITPLEKIPAFNGYDLITSYGMLPLGHHGGGPSADGKSVLHGWKPVHRYFAQNCVDLLNDGGRLVLLVNRSPATEDIINTNHWAEFTGIVAITGTTLTYRKTNASNH